MSFFSSVVAVNKAIREAILKRYNCERLFYYRHYFDLFKRKLYVNVIKNVEIQMNVLFLATFKTI